MDNKTLYDYLNEKYEQRRLVNGRMYSDTKNTNFQMNQEQFINTYLNKPYILSGYSCLYENQDNVTNISSAALENLGAMRKINKKKMEEAPHGSAEYIYYRILQLTYKVLMNSYYGMIKNSRSNF